MKVVKTFQDKLRAELDVLQELVDVKSDCGQQLKKLKSDCQNVFDNLETILLSKQGKWIRK